MTVLSVSNATKSFGAVKALDGVSFDLRQGELLALLGPKGAGKTTLMRAIAGRVQLDAGDILLLGAPVTAGRTPLALGIVPQEIARYPLLTARENLRAFGALQGLSGPELAEGVEWAIDRASLTDRSSEPVKTFSGGLKRRLSIACGVLHRPRVVLLDEPTAGVDPQSRDRIYDMLLELAEGGTSLLLTTHHLEEAEARWSRTVIVDHGRTIAEGTLPELVDRTVGHHRLVTLRLDAPLDGAAVAMLDASSEVDSRDRRTARARLGDVVSGLPPLLERVRQAGGVVEDVDARGQSLQAVFIHLTGRELRE